MGIDVTLSTNAVKHLGSAASKIDSSTQKLMTGKKNPSESVVSVLKGLQNEATAKVLSAVAESAKYGSTVLDVASSHLYDLLDNLTELRTTIAQADTADSGVLANLNALYQSKVAAIISELTNANFGGKLLFDGSLTTPANPVVYNAAKDATDKAIPGGTVPKEGIAATASALSIRVGETFNNNISINIPRLLSGLDFKNPDTIVPGRLTPLFPITQTAIDLKNAATKTFLEIVTVLGSKGTRDEVAKAIKDIDPAKDTAGNARTLTPEQLTILTAAKAAAAAAVGANNLEGANVVFNQTVNAVLDAASPYISADAISAYRSILDIEKNLADDKKITNATTSTEYTVITNKIALPGNIVGDDIISFIQDGTKLTDATGKFYAQKKATFEAIITADTINANPVLAAGNILTPANRKSADAIAVAATETVKSMIASVVGQQSILDGSIDSLNTQIAANKEAANDLLSANIVEASNEVKQILSLIQSVYFVLGNVDKINQLNAILLRS